MRKHVFKSAVLGSPYSNAVYTVSFLLESYESQVRCCMSFKCLNVINFLIDNVPTKLLSFVPKTLKISYYGFDIPST